MTKLSWTQPICERCWIEAEGEWALEVTGDGGHQRLSRLRFPVRVTQVSIERCSWCGSPTILGAYKRADPRAVPYPAVADYEQCPERDGKEHLWVDDPPNLVRCIECGYSRETLKSGELP